MANAAQAFPNEGLDFIFNQLGVGLSGGNPTTPASTGINPYYVGLLTSSSNLGTQVPYGAATLAVLDSSTGYTGTYTTSGGGTGTGVTFYELGAQSGTTATGYSRLSCQFTLSATAGTTLASTGTLGATSASGAWTLNLGFSSGSYASLTVGMTVSVTDATSTVEQRVITALPGSPTVVLSAALSATCNSGATWSAGDAVNGQKAAGAAVTFTAQSAWPSVTGYFIAGGGATASGTTGKLLYIANFADTSTPQLNPNDSLTVTPTWLLSN